MTTWIEDANAAAIVALHNHASALLAAARRVPELEGELADLRELCDAKSSGWKHAEECVTALQAQLDEAKGKIGLLKSQYDQMHALAVEAATKLKAAEARANAAEEGVKEYEPALRKIEEIARTAYAAGIGFKPAMRKIFEVAGGALCRGMGIPLAILPPAGKE